MKILYPSFFALIALLSSCNKEILNDENPLNSNQSTSFSLEEAAKTLAVDCEVVYVAYREFVLTHPEYIYKEQIDTSNAYYNHLENRLIDFYPDRAYIGMIQDADGFYEQLLQQDELELTQVDSSDVTLNDSLPSFNFYQKELDLESSDLDWLLAMESLASQYPSNPASYNEIMELSALRSNKTNGIWATVLSVIVAHPAASAAVGAGVVLAGYDIYWARKCKQRAKEETHLRFDASEGYNDRADAFRHISASMMLRRYVGQAQAAGWVHEIVNKNECAEHQMDFHNNKVGSKTQYWYFRNKPQFGKKDYKLWCDRIETFTKSQATNGHCVVGTWLYSTDPTDEAITCSDMKADRKNNISSLKYIYIK